jgi:non-canonical purine NTP pyrophosphatase (RdgB/HAM1 family)
MEKTIFYVTTNKGKFEEVSSYLEQKKAPFTLEMASLDIPEIQTLDQHAIALDKANKAWDILQKPLIVDDAAIYFKRYKDFPGTMSKFISQGMGITGIKRLFDEGDEAFYKLTFVYVWNHQKQHIIQAECHGTLTANVSIIARPDLPYDTFFIPRGSSVPNAVHAKRDNPNYFYRIQATEKFLNWYVTQKSD